MAVARYSSGGAAIHYIIMVLMDDVTFGRRGSYGDAWSGVVILVQSLMSMDTLLIMSVVL